MDNAEIYRLLIEKISEDNIFQNESMKKHHLRLVVMQNFLLKQKI